MLLDKLSNSKDTELSSEEIKSLMRADRRDREMAMNIIGEATLDEFEKELDEKINERILNNESPNEIIKSLIQGKKKAPKLTEEEAAE